jgi:hypothetical protein
MPPKPPSDPAAQSRPQPSDLLPTTLEDLSGCAGYNGPRVSLEEMEDAIRQGALDSGSYRDKGSSC